MIFDCFGCEEIIGYTFNDKMLLRQALTYSSYAHEHHDGRVEKDNELLEFFGDSVIQFIVTEYLYKNGYGDEGKLTDKRKLMVSREPLYNSVIKLGLDKFFLVGNGQAKSLEADQKKLMKFVSSAYEALVAAIYIDGGMICAKEFVKRTIIADFEKGRRETQKKPQTNGWKNLLQEYVQKNHLGELTYKTLAKIGPDHLPEYKEVALLNGAPLAEGKGATRKLAQSQAAESALKRIKSRQVK